MLGLGVTLTVTAAIFTQPAAEVPVTVYVVVAVGLADGFAQFVQDNPVAGAQVYVEAPVAVSVVDVPWHIVTFEPALTVGIGATVTVTVAVFEHPVVAFVPVTVYVVVTVGQALGLATFVADRPVAGLHT
jgi:hypothetical protein